MYRAVICTLVLLVVAVTYCPAEQAMPLNVIPKPTHVEMRGDGFELTADTVILVDEAAQGVGEYLAQMLAPATGFRLSIRNPASGDNTGNVIHLRLDTDADALNEEGYRLEATPEKIDISAKTPAGLFYGCQTLRQLLPVEIDSGTVVEGVTWAVPGIVIEDTPRFGWRGLHLDPCRHFFDVEFTKRYIDLMARYKLNTFHWHLTEDQGWRIEIKGHPKLTEIGAWRKGEDGKPYGGFYTQEDIREVVAYAKSRFVTVVPEIEMPGHSQAALAAYPELACTSGPSTFEVGTRWGIYKDVYCAGNDKTFEMLEDVLTEVMDLFPGTYIHVGGDEAPKDRWRTCERCQARIQAQGLEDEHELQSYFIKRIDTFLARHGRKLIGWDEILEGGLAPGAAVMSWRGIKGGIEAAKLKRYVVMTPHTHLYFDFKQSDDPDELGALYEHNPNPLRRVYGYEPIPDELTADEAQYILGAQANVWTEAIQTPDQIEYMILPRVLGLAEIVWSSKDDRDWDDFEIRVIGEYDRYELLGLNYRDHRK